MSYQEEIASLSLPEWRKAKAGEVIKNGFPVNGWVCDDDEEMKFGFFASFCGFDLPAFDLWLERLEDEEGKEELLKRREQAKRRMQQTGSLSESDFKPFLEVIYYLQGLVEILPHAEHGLADRA